MTRRCSVPAVPHLPAAAHGDAERHHAALRPLRQAQRREAPLPVSVRPLCAIVRVSQPGPSSPASLGVRGSGGTGSRRHSRTGSAVSTGVNGWPPAPHMVSVLSAGPQTFPRVTCLLPRQGQRYSPHPPPRGAHSGVTEGAYSNPIESHVEVCLACRRMSSSGTEVRWRGGEGSWH